ncbi:WxL domain-containing protein [Enterococcus sp. HY326]|uniref:WxL domain-containing protein n=1 Tax=Enterococcus sp. HY326 TaxID=2971265 RepID=UPI00224019FF|nr:WxL domain-containing protein [Enterococcus sp. HY326]
MKFKSLCATTLLTVIAVGTLAPAVAGAATTSPHSVISEGRVIVDVEPLDPTDPMIDPEDPDNPGGIDPDNPEITPGENLGAFGITNVTKLNFGTILVGTDKTDYFAEAVDVDVFTDETLTTTQAVKRGAMVQFGDNRGLNYGYDVSVRMTRQFQLVTATDPTTGAATTWDTTKSLTGATITYDNGIMETKSTNTATPGTLNGGLAAITESGNSVPVVEAGANEGQGKYVLEFGQSEDYDQTNSNLVNKNVGGTPAVGTADSSVKLYVPLSTLGSLTVGNYTADITWTMTSGPTI